MRQRGRGRIGLWIPWPDGWGAGCTVPAHQEPHRGRHDDASGHLHFTSRAPGRVASVTPTVGLHKLFASHHCQTAWPQHGCGRWCHERCSPCPSACRIVRAVPHRCCHGETREQAEDLDCAACTARAGYSTVGERAPGMERRGTGFATDRRCEPGRSRSVACACVPSLGVAEISKRTRATCARGSLCAGQKSISRGKFHH